MHLHRPLLGGRLLGRRKRFFVDVALADGAQLVAHCPNTGRLLGCLDPGAEVVLQGRDRPGRKLPWTWVLVRSAKAWVGVESVLAIPMVIEAIAGGRLPALTGFGAVHRELRYGPNLRSRIDIVLADDERIAVAALAARRCRVSTSTWVEVKSTTLVQLGAGVRVGMFPDAPSERGRKHLADLVDMRARGQRAALVFAVQRGDVDAFAPADHIDPAYGDALRRAMLAGVEVYALRTAIRVQRRAGELCALDLQLTEQLPLLL
ncbi:MAG: DNA/RNA nuclease SfsA [Deltaproteobacteria bacterium]|nr:DNA/RNA nuclease SfsA [Nannocystaceae bacterium]